jgi:hypothetical protein
MRFMAGGRERLTLGLSLLCLVSSTGCGAATRRSMGSTVMALGALTGLASVRVMTGGCTRHAAARLTDPTGEGPCIEHTEPDRLAGAMVLTAGLTVVVAGGILLASGIPNPPPPAGSGK